MKRIITSIFLLAFTASASAQESPAQLAARLGSGNYAERQRTALALEKLGRSALPALRELAKSSDLETRRRAILVMEAIEDRAEIEDLMQASPVRLRFKDLPIQDALREVERLTGLQAGNVPGTKRIAELDTGAVPFWQAWRKFCDAAQLQESDFARSAAPLERLSDERVKSLSATAGSLELDLRPKFANFLRFTATPEIDRCAEDNRHSVRVRVKWQSVDRKLDKKVAHAVFAVEVRPEPRMEIVKWPRAEVTKIIDGKGIERAVKLLKLIPENAGLADIVFLEAFSGEMQYGGLLQLKPLAWEGPAVTLKELHGKVRMDVTARPRLLEIANVAKSAGKEVRSFDGITLKVLEADRDEDGDFQLRLHLDNLGSLAPQTPEQKIVRVRPGVIAVRGEIDVALERLELRDAAGRKCALIRARYEHAAKGKGYDVDLTFAAVGGRAEDLTLVLTKAPRRVPLEIPFVVRDVGSTPEK